MKTAEQIRDLPLEHFAGQAEDINDSDDLMKVFAAPEWQELGDDMRAWVCALVRETLAQAAEARQ